MHSKLTFCSDSESLVRISKYLVCDSEARSEIHVCQCQEQKTNFTTQCSTSTGRVQVAVIFQHSAAALPNSSSRSSSWSNVVNHGTLEQSEHAWRGSSFWTLRKHLTHFSDTSSFRDALSWFLKVVQHLECPSMWGKSRRYIRKNTSPLTIQQLPRIIIFDFPEMDFCDSGTGDGCARFFPNKLSPGLCAECTKLATFTEGSSEYEQWKVCPSRLFHVKVDFYFFH